MTMRRLCVAVVAVGLAGLIYSTERYASAQGGVNPGTITWDPTYPKANVAPGPGQNGSVEIYGSFTQTPGWTALNPYFVYTPAAGGVPTVINLGRQNNKVGFQPGGIPAPPFGPYILPLAAGNWQGFLEMSYRTNNMPPQGASAISSVAAFKI